MTANETKWNDRFIYVHIYMYDLHALDDRIERDCHGTLGGDETKRERERHAIDTKPNNNFCSRPSSRHVAGVCRIEVACQ